MPAGYPIASTWISDFQRTQTSHGFKTNGRWFFNIYSTVGNDWFLHEWDGGVPVLVGATSNNWTRIANVSPSTIQSSSPDTFWDEANQRLHCVKLDQTEYYQRYLYDAGANTWSQEVTNENVGVGISGSNGTVVVDLLQRPWITHRLAGDLYGRVRNGGVWETSVSISSPGDIIMHDACEIVDNSGNGGVFVTWYSSTLAQGGAFRFDSQATTAAWTNESAVMWVGNDDHNNVQSIVLAGDTGSTVLAVSKDGSDNISIARRDPGTGDWGTQTGGTGWSSAVIVVADSSRPKIVLDATNEDVYVFYNDRLGGEASITYKKAAISDLVFGPEIVAIENDPGVSGYKYVAVPSHNITGSEIIVLAQGDASVVAWFGVVALPTSVETLGAEAGSYALSGSTVDTLHDQVIQIDQGSYVLSGSTVDILHDQVIQIDQGSYVLSGSTVDILHDQVIQIDQGSYTITGALVDTRVISGAVSQIEQGSYTITGALVDTLQHRRIQIEQGSYALSGSTVDTLHDQVIQIEAGSYVIAGALVDTRRELEISIDQGSYALSGSTVDTLHNPVLRVDQGSYTITGSLVDTRVIQLIRTNVVKWEHTITRRLSWGDAQC